MGKVNSIPIDLPRLFERGMLVMLGLSVSGYFWLPSGQANNFPTYLLGIFVVAHLITSGQNRFKALSHSSVFRASVVVLLYLLVSSTWSAAIVPREVVSLVGNCLLILCFLCAIWMVSTSVEDVVIWMSTIIILSAVISALYFLLGSMFDTSLRVPYGRWNTTQVAGIGYGLGLIMAVHRIISDGLARWRLLWTACVIVLLLACIRLNAEYVWFAMAAAITVLAFAKVWESRKSPTAFVWIVVSGCMFLLTLYWFDLVLESNRRLIWSHVVESIYASNLLVGNGALTSTANTIVGCADNSALRESLGSCNFQHPHNLYVSTLYYGGVIGLVLLLMVILVAFGTVFGSRNHSKWLVNSVLAYGCGIFLFDGLDLISKINYIWLIFWLPVGFSISLDLPRQSGSLQPGHLDGELAHELSDESALAGSLRATEDR